MQYQELNSIKILMWGTYDLGKPRTRLIRDSLRRSSYGLIECHLSVWEGAEDKSVLRPLQMFTRAIRWLTAYPVLIWKFCRMERPDVVVVGYLGHLDVIILWPFARFRQVPIVWDAFLSLYDTVVLDRRMVAPHGLASRALSAWERLACLTADTVVLDTEAQAQFFRERYKLSNSKVVSIWVGAEQNAFQRVPSASKCDTATVLFYGQFIPLHGVATIIEAARLAADRPLRWRIIGTGQDASLIKTNLEIETIENLDWSSWVSYHDLASEISAADVCLGVFGTSEKAGRVIPNKVYQILSAGRPLVTRDGPGIRELIAERSVGVELVSPGDPVALLEAVERLLDARPFPDDLHAVLAKSFSRPALTKQWQALIESVVSNRKTSASD